MNSPRAKAARARVVPQVKQGNPVVALKTHRVTPHWSARRTLAASAAPANAIAAMVECGMRFQIAIGIRRTLQ